ncbi:hypothetical protein N9W41_01630 [bacterium]|nr:hypothetical protein [bacterium]
MSFLRLCLFIIIPFNVYATTNPEVDREEIYYQNLNTFEMRVYEFICRGKSISCEEQKNIYIQALVEYKNDHPKVNVEDINLRPFSALQKLRLIRELELKNSVSLGASKASSDAKKYYCHERDYFNQLGIYIDGDCTKKKTTIITDVRIFKDLFFGKTELEKYYRGHYQKGVKLYQFCRQDRGYACLIVMKDKDNNPLRTSDGELLARPSLAYSKYRKPYYQTDGHTPMGIFEINSVMPKANKYLRYGKFRRLILHRVNKSKNFKNNKLLLPKAHHNLNWWKQADEAYDNGRGMFRIHGTGYSNSDPEFDTYFPFTPTRGCVAQREGNFQWDNESASYVDQDVLLNILMRAQGLDVIYDNHVQIKGLLYVIEIDNKKRPVNLTDLHNLGIQ